jgi:hypothetical protein
VLGVTLDTDCTLVIEEQRPVTVGVRELPARHEAGTAVDIASRPPRRDGRNAAVV